MAEPTALRQAPRARRRPWPVASILAITLAAASIAHCSEAPDDLVNAQAPPQASEAPTTVDVDADTAPASSGISRLKIDLASVDRRSNAYRRFRDWVDSAVAGSPGYAFAAGDAALMYRLSDSTKYCDLAVRMVDEQVASAESVIADGGRPEIAGDSYLEVGPRIADLALTLDSCAEMVSTEQRARWSAYAEQSVWNVWNHASARWGGRPHPWTGWSTDNPGNNYYYSFLEATMFWALVSGSERWTTELVKRRLPPLKAYFAGLPGGGSREGTGYGAAQMRLFSLYRLWRDSTGEDLAAASTHARDTIPYWIHATVPTMDRFAPIGDQSRNSVPEIYDYHRRLVLEARQLTDDADALAISSWWLKEISVPQMSGGFNLRHDLLPAGSDGAPPRALSHHATGSGHVFSRTGWDRDAMWLAFVAGPYNESHAHQDQGSFTLFSGDWLAVTENIWTHSGIQQGTEVHNVVRFERKDTGTRQCAAPANDVVVHQCENPDSRSALQLDTHPDGSISASADLTPVYRGNPALVRWNRRLDFKARTLNVKDDFELGPGTTAIFQLNVPVQPVVTGSEVVAGRLRMRVLAPADPIITIHDWSSVDKQEFRRGWRIDVRGGQTGYLVELTEL